MPQIDVLGLAPVIGLVLIALVVIVVVLALRNKVSASKIVREVWGVSGGDAYQRAAREYSAIVAQIVGGA